MQEGSNFKAYVPGNLKVLMEMVEAAQNNNAKLNTAFSLFIPAYTYPTT